MNNSTCPFCGSSLGSSPTTKSDKIYCGFCEMFVIPSVNGERLDQLKKPEFISHEHIRLNTPQLMEMHTKSLLEMLRSMLEERRNYYNQMRILKRGAAEDPKFIEWDRMSSEEYEMMTRKCFVVEKIIHQDAMIESLKRKIKRLKDAVGDRPPLC
ncbi:hypothetical protein [Bacillus sp. OTU2372]|uniref:hypothetical protein n=2 Tax=Bacillaceae TaxID=186817 RepID=UPI00313F2605